ncbi:hypothetical protein DPEC_G00099820 [Dallia pectoralis]|uniref:Uncharacterized protein n=1 Tax=Dallia pectoralis TaxID=75939 RepID=A0ACC2GWR9_DALPE|nr:hypothetical protein DPEC_G00099820 [Dallia pectoralis]
MSNLGQILRPPFKAVKNDGRTQYLLLSFHQACEVARVRASLPGQERQALVGFGQYKRERLQDLYNATDKKRVGKAIHTMMKLRTKV